MLKKIFLTLLLLPLAMPVMAQDEPNNPGDDNPGTTYIERDYVFGVLDSGSDSCSVTAEICAEGSYIYPPAEQLRGKKQTELALNEAGGAAAIACTAAAAAEASWMYMYEGEGTLVIARHGNHGAVHRIKLDADLSAATMTGASASADASAYAEASAWAVAGATSFADWCEEIFEWQGDLVPPELVLFCADAIAIAESSSSAEAWALAVAGSEAMAASNSYAAASINNQVWAANIEKYETTLVTGAGSFSAASAEANAAAYASAYAEAFAYAFAQACAGEVLPEFEYFCDSDENTYSYYAVAYAQAFANARAEAMAGVEITVLYDVLYKNENGIDDTITFGPDPFTDFGQIYAEVECAVNEVDD